LTLAEDALRRGDPARALSILDALVAAYPDGETAAEREYYAVVALHRMARDDESRARAERLSARFPLSPAAARVHRMFGIPATHENATSQ
jgi:TolA-binding protein